MLITRSVTATSTHLLLQRTSCGPLIDLRKRTGVVPARRLANLRRQPISRCGKSAEKRARHAPDCTPPSEQTDME